MSDAPDNDGDSFRVRGGGPKSYRAALLRRRARTNLRQGDRRTSRALHFGITLDETIESRREGEAADKGAFAKTVR